MSASSAASTSLSPRREYMYRRLPTSTGDAYPSPTSTLHFRASSSGHGFGSVNDATAPSRFGPRHCGQSEERFWAETMPSPLHTVKQHAIERPSNHESTKPRNHETKTFSFSCFRVFAFSWMVVAGMSGVRLLFMISA
ncbi:MAG: hypothetical protein AUH72_12025 [Acidobacteria bacterium 13_1_40CM_4_65_8]|nr:MAG: hypothetical protein AUH72_12025 [Acidobacteria bacterium 13_1_40CM_4_65_8]